MQDKEDNTWQKDCFEFINSKDNSHDDSKYNSASLKKFITSCPDDPEARIYQNNKDAKKSGKKIYKIAVSVPIRSEYNEGVFDSVEILKGVEIAQRKINQSSNNKFSLQISIIDDGYVDSGGKKTRETEAQKAAKLLSEKSEILGVVGHYSSNATQAAAEVYQHYELVAISPTSTAVRKTNILPGEEIKLNKYIFRTSPDDEKATKKLIDYLDYYHNQNDKSKGINYTVAFSYEIGDSYGKLFKE